MAYNPYGGQYGAPQHNYSPYPGAHHPNAPPPSMGYPPPGMSPAAAASSPPPGMAPPPGMHYHPPSAPQANRPPSGPHGYGGRGHHMMNGHSGYASPNGLPLAPAGYQGPPPNLPSNINFNAPVIRLGSTSNGPPPGPGVSSLPARPTVSAGPGMYNNGVPAGPGGERRGFGRDPDTLHSAGSSASTPLRPDFRGGGDRFDRFDRGGGGGDRFDRFDRYDRANDGRADRGGDRDGPRSGVEQARAAVRDSMHSHVPPTRDEILRTIFVHKVPAGVGGESALQQLLGLAGRLRRWDSGKSQLSDHKGELFGFAQYEDANSLASAIELLKNVYLPVEKQEYKDNQADVKSSTEDKEEKKGAEKGSETMGEKHDDDVNDTDGPFKGIKKVPLQVAVDPVSLKYIEAFQEKQSDEAKAEAKARCDALRPALESAVHKLFYPPKPDPAATDNGSSDVLMTDISGIPLLTGTGLDGIDVSSIPLAAAANQEDELADVPAEMREMVAAEIAMFRDRSTQRDLERLKREQEMEELERRRNGEDNAVPARVGRLESPAPGSSSTNNYPLGARSRIGFVNASREDRDRDHRDRDRDRRDRDRREPDSDASDDEIYRREQRRIQIEDEREYNEAERKWAMRERQRAAALERERDRDRAEADNAERHRTEALERDANWDDEREASRKAVLYYRDHTEWLRKRAHVRADEEARDAADRRAEQDEARRQAAAMEAVRDQADSFLDGMGQVDEELERKKKAEDDEKEKATQKVTISFGAAAQRKQAQRGATTRRTVAEVEGLLDDGEHDGATKRQLVPIKFEPMAASARMSDEEINAAVRALVQEIPTTQQGLWAWPVQWSYMDDGVVRDKLRPFVEKKVVEYLGVQEQFLVEVVETHLRKHGTPEALVDELQEALDEAAEDLVKKLWRMVIFFTESEKRGLPA
ncbi:hypothetical protein SEPCBS119000_002847 [Sporothrix epigloea]|uniref:PWI domain-containing protein n=1 Tax=Sporothrix epigloea TaxID=1892477 RepID=A0ABP0DLS5_9PEZI